MQAFKYNHFIDFLTTKPHFQVFGLGILSTKLKRDKTTFKNKFLIDNLPPLRDAVSAPQGPPLATPLGVIQNRR